MISYDLLKDLNSLFCQTGNKQVEDLFIKLAADNETDFLTWLEKNKNNRVLSSKLGDKIVLQALAYLIVLKKRIPPDEVLNYFVQGKDPNPQYIPVYTLFNRLLGDPNARGLLYHFEDILKRFRAFTPSLGWITEGEVLSDLKAIDEEHQSFIQHSLNKPFDDGIHTIRQKKAPTRKQKIEKLFIFLLKNFTDDIVNTLDNYPEEKDLANEIRKGSLADPMKIVPLLKYPPQASSVAPVKKFIREMSKRMYGMSYANEDAVSRRLESMYNDLRNAIMLSLNFMDREEYHSYRSDNEDLSLFLENDSSEEFPIYDAPEEQKPFPFHEDLIRHEDYILVVSSVLYNLHQQIR